MIKLIFKIICNKDIIVRALKLSIVVGTILNIINQYDMMLEIDLSKINWFKFSLTYTIPFLVSMYTAISMKLSLKSGDLSPVDILVRCPYCNAEIVLREEELIPICLECNKKVDWAIKDIISL